MKINFLSVEMQMTSILNEIYPSQIEIEHEKFSRVIVERLDF